MEEFSAGISSLIAATPELESESSPLVIGTTEQGWNFGMVSWVATHPSGLLYILHRGEGAPNVVALDREGAVVRAWGEGLFETPHSLRIDPEGHVWTTDSGNSRVLKFTAEGELLLRIDVGGIPENCRSSFCGVTDIAFGPGNRLFVSDGYRNARILEYDAEGILLQEWGRPGAGPGEFHLPHSILVLDQTLYVADRENGRVQRFTLDGRFIGEILTGKVFSLAASEDAVWASAQHLHEPNLSPGWLLRIDPATGEVTGRIPSTGGHGMDLSSSDQLMIAPGPDFTPQRFQLGQP